MIKNNLPCALRPYEISPIAVAAVGSLSENFQVDFIAVIKYAIDNCWNEDSRREKFNMPPEPYSINPELLGDKEGLIEHALKVLESGGDSWQWLYNNLSDEQSRFMLLSILAYRAIGWRYIKLPLDNQAFWDCLTKVGKSILNKPKKKVTSYNIELTDTYLGEYGVDVQLFTDTFGVFNEFLYSQYVYRADDAQYGPNMGDYVIDCGACFGGTSLFFANQVGRNGHVFSFEFIEENVETFLSNIELNPQFKERITLVRHPLWSKSGEDVFISGTGPGASVHTDKEKGGERVSTLTIDDLVKNKGVKKVDFIKMDIEGAEMGALYGARETISEFKPTLAISVYHQLADFYEVPQFVRSISDDYQFFIQHSTVHGDETVVFAIDMTRGT